MADSASNDSLIIDPMDVIFDEHGNVESMTDPDTGETVTSDEVPEARQPRGPYDETDDDGNNAGDENGNGNTAGDADLDPVLADTLAVYGLVDEDGNATDAIEWNGEETRVRDLSAEDRREFLQELRDSAVREAAGTTAEEQELLDFLRQGGDLREALGLPASAGGQVSALSADEVNLADIRNQYPGLSDDEVQEELADRKLSARYESKTGQIRERLTQAEQVATTKAADDEFQAARQVFVETANRMPDVLGFKIEPAVREFLLAQTATQEANGESPFLNSLTPEKVLRLQFLDSYAGQIDQHYKSEVDAAYKRGRADMAKGAPTSPSGRGGSAGNTKPVNPRDQKSYADYTLGE